MPGSFLENEDGAVTIDWVVLTAALVGLGLAVIGSIRGGFVDQSTSIQRQLDGTTVEPRF